TGVGARSEPSAASADGGRSGPGGTRSRRGGMRPVSRVRRRRANGCRNGVGSAKMPARPHGARELTLRARQIEWVTMRQFDDKTSWDGARGDVLFTVSVLNAAEVHGKLLKALRKQLEAWQPLDVARRAAEDDIVVANARVAWCDLVLDRAVRLFAN